MAGESLTLAVRIAVGERLLRVRRDHGDRDIAVELLATSAHCAALPDLDLRSPDDILGYDENGLPN